MSKGKFGDKTPIIGKVTVIKNQGKDNEQVIQLEKENLLTEAGRDFFHDQCYVNTIAGTQGSNYIALSNDGVHTPVAGDTFLPGEIVISGLERFLGTPVHTPGTAITTISHVFTATAPVLGVRLSGLFNVAGPPVAGILTHELAFASAVDLDMNDTLTITWTLTLG